MPRSKVCSLQILIVINSRGEKGYPGDVLLGEGLFWDTPGPLVKSLTTFDRKKMENKNPIMRQQ